MNGNKFATGQILQKPVEVVKGRILAGWARESPQPCFNDLQITVCRTTHRGSSLESGIRIIVNGLNAAHLEFFVSKYTYSSQNLVFNVQEAINATLIIWHQW